MDGVGVDLESLRREITDEIQRLDQRRTVLMEKVRNLEAVEDLGALEKKEPGPGEQRTASSPLDPSEENLPAQAGLTGLDEMLSALRCLKCGSSLRSLIPTDAAGNPNICSPRLGQSHGGNRFLECPQCGARNVFVRTTGPQGWRLLVTQLAK